MNLSFPAPSVSFLLLGGALMLAAGCSKAERSSVARGEYIVKTSGCVDCHTPHVLGAEGPAPDLARHLSGHPETMALPPAPVLPEGPWMVTAAASMTAWSGPWGVSFTANLTPDPETGLGKWNAETFRTALRTGRHMGSGRPILPPMPWPVYGNLTDDDLDSVFAYLQSIPAIRNRVPEPIAPGVR